MGALQVFVSDITLSSSGIEDAVIMAQSWVNRYHTQTYGPRVFFKVPTACAWVA